MRENMERRRLAGFPGDLLVLLMLPAYGIFASVVGPQRIWIFLLLVGGVQVAAGLFVVRRSRFSVLAWLTIAVGILGVTAAIGIGLTRLRHQGI